MRQSLRSSPLLLLTLLCVIPHTAAAVGKIEHVEKGTTCTPAGCPTGGDCTKWSIVTTTVVTAGIANSTGSQRKVGIEFHSISGDPIATITDAGGDPIVITSGPNAGRTVALVASPADAAEANALFGTKAGFVWRGYRTNYPLPLLAGNYSVPFRTEFFWAGGVKGNGALWVSDNADSLYGYIVEDGHFLIPPASPLPALPPWGLGLLAALLFALAAWFVIPRRTRLSRA